MAIFGMQAFEVGTVPDGIICSDTAYFYTGHLTNSWKLKNPWSVTNVNKCIKSSTALHVSAVSVHLQDEIQEW